MSFGNFIWVILKMRLILHCQPRSAPQSFAARCCVGRSL